MRARILSAVVALCLVVGSGGVRGEERQQLERVPPEPGKVVNAALKRVAALVEPAADGEAAKTFTATLRVTKAEGLPKEVAGAAVEVAVQAPDRVGFVAHVNGETFAGCRDGQEIWAHVPEKKFGVIGKPGVRRFSADPSSVVETLRRGFRAGPGCRSGTA